MTYRERLPLHLLLTNGLIPASHHVFGLPRMHITKAFSVGVKSARGRAAVWFKEKKKKEKKKEKQKRDKQEVRL